MSKSFWSLLILLPALALVSASCVRPRPSPTPMPTKTTLKPPAAATSEAPTVEPTATLEATSEPTAEPTPEVTPTVEPTEPATGQRSYQVRWGDTLSRIAQAHGTTVEAIMAANPSITDPARVNAGMVLVIPAQGSTPPATQPTAAPSGPTSYVVQWGDTLYRIALRFGTTEAAIMAANPSITDPTRIYAGMTLVIPGTGGATGARTHTVRYGETLSSIARQYGTTVLAIVQANNLPNSNTIYTGQVLVIP